MASPSAPGPRSYIERMQQKLHLPSFFFPTRPRLSRGPLYLDSDSDSDGDDGGHIHARTGLSPSQPSRSHRLVLRCNRTLNSLYCTTCRHLSSDIGRGVLKCSFAYLLGSMATFIEPIASWIGNGQDTKHTVATLTVYFHPARTQGSMYKASICALLAFVYATFINISSMAVSMFFEDTLHMLPLGHAVVLIVFCGGGLGFVGWVKQRLADPLVNTACSLASLAMITVLTKEGDVQQGELSFEPIVRVLKMLFLGVTVTVVVCLTVFPQSARLKLRESTIALTGSLSDMLSIITEGFLMGNSDSLEKKDFLSASQRNKKAYHQIDQILKEAKLEHYLTGTERQYRLEKNLVRCVQDLVQSVGGLRSAAILQSDLLKQASAAATSDHERPLDHPQGVLRPVEPIDAGSSLGASSHVENDVPPLQTPEDIFNLFIEHLGPAMKSLVQTFREILSDLPFGPPPDYNVVFQPGFHARLDNALRMFRRSRSEALRMIYSHKEIGAARCTELEADYEEVAASCGHFSFSLQEFGEQLRGFFGAFGSPTG
ncbi:hypothetical protein AAP_00818 [Ascosphaera apis ARSEF 7405]|uniref:Uncharacterized protein n=1 Tax=Ascosphaera apis ARSEF 7405 TaxID=392613 RepID=A0A168CYW7_9EURO|nr:hypothetical protein AAP_00818 [Ascosphaera apis ARSEF 7405]